MKKATIFTSGSIDARFFSRILKHKEEYRQIDIKMKLEEEDNQLLHYTEYLLQHKDKKHSILIKDCKEKSDIFTYQDCSHIAALVVAEDEQEIEIIKHEIKQIIRSETELHFLTIDNTLEKILHCLITQKDHEELNCIKNSLENVKYAKKIIIMFWIKKYFPHINSSHKIKKIEYLSRTDCEYLEVIKNELHSFIHK